MSNWNKKILVIFYWLTISFHCFAGGPGSGRHRENYGKGGGDDGIGFFLIIIAVIILFIVFGIGNSVSRKTKIKVAKAAFLQQIDKLLHDRELTYEQWAELKKNIDVKGLSWATQYVKRLADMRNHERSVAAAKKKREEESALEEKKKQDSIDEFISRGDSLLANDEISGSKWNQIKPTTNSVGLYELNARLNALIAERKKEKEIEKFFTENAMLGGDGQITVDLWNEVKAKINYMGVEWAREMVEYGKQIKIRYDSLLKKYGDEKGGRIFREEFFVGMTKDELLDSKGDPTKIENEVMKTKTKETWIYGNKSSGDVFVFENSVLVRFKDR